MMMVIVNVCNHHSHGNHLNNNDHNKWASKDCEREVMYWYRIYAVRMGKLTSFWMMDCADKCDALRVAAHERLGEVLRILRIILEHYPALQSTELLVAAGSLIHQVKGKSFAVVMASSSIRKWTLFLANVSLCPTLTVFVVYNSILSYSWLTRIYLIFSYTHDRTEHPYEDEKSDVRDFMESIDQLALAFSSR